nr:hypothetical protein [Tanacetum cinerariifolium]
MSTATYELFALNFGLGLISDLKADPSQMIDIHMSLCTPRFHSNGQPPSSYCSSSSTFFTHVLPMFLHGSISFIKVEISGT